MNEVNERNVAEGLFRGVVLIADYMKEANQNLLDTLMNPSERKTAIETQRSALWNGRHPNRWTDRNLQADVIEADRFLGGEIRNELGHSLSEYYETEYRRMNWYVHGSALASMRGLSPETFVCVC